MPKIDLPQDLEEAQSCQEAVRITRATAKRLGSVERDAPTTPKRSHSALSLETISEDSSTSLRNTRSTKKTSPMSPINEKELPDSRTTTPRRTRRSSVAAESPGEHAFRTLRRQAKEHSDTEESTSTTTNTTNTSNPREPRQTRQRTESNLTQRNLESLNGKSVTFDESPEREKEHTQFPKTPVAEKQKGAEGKESDTSFESILSDKVAVVCLERLTSFNISDEQQDKQVPEVTSTESAQETEKNSVEAESETVEDVAVTETVEVADKNAEEGDKGEKEEGMEKSGEENADVAVEEFSTSWTQAVTGRNRDEVPIDAFGEKERKQEEEKLQEHAEKVAKENAEYKLVKIYSDEEEDQEEEEGKERSDFIDEEAIEVSESDESMDPEEREYLRQQEIPEDGIDLGSEDTGSNQEDGDDVTEDDINFIAFSDEEDVFEKEDSLDKLVEKCEKVEKKTRKRIREIEDSSDEEIEPPVETYKNSALLKFSGATLEKLLEEDERDKAVIEADFDQDITMASPHSIEKQKKTPKKTPVSRNLETNFQKAPEVKAKTPEKPQEMEQDEPEEASASEKEEEVGESDSQNWEDIEEEEEEEEAPKDNAKISAVMARCEEFLQKRHDIKAAQKQINEEKRAKKRAAKERKKQMKKEEMERRAERERFKEELMEQKKREKEVQQTLLKEEKVKDIPVMPAEQDPNLKMSKKDKKLPIEGISIQDAQPTQKKKKDKSQELLSQELEGEIVPESNARKKKKKEKVESLPEGAHEGLTKKKKKKLRLEEPLQAPSNSAKRLPDLLLSQLSASDERSVKAQLKKKRRADEDLDIAKPQKKHKSAKENIPELPKLINTPTGRFNVEPLKNPFSVQDAKLIKKAQVTKQFKREKQLKRKKSVQEPSVVFPRPTTSWTSTGVFHVTDLQPQMRVVNADAGVPMEFVVTTLEPKRKLGKKSTATSVFEAEAKKPVKGFKEAKLYGNGTVREYSTDLMHRKIKKKLSHK